eukprot:Filipodium_phascolosomae@DN5771_c0_g1_i1.p1
MQAPESRNGHYSIRSDIWSLGVILLEHIYNRLALCADIFSEMDTSLSIFQIVHLIVNKEKKFGKGYGTLDSGLLTAAQLVWLKHWHKKQRLKMLCEKMLTFNEDGMFFHSKFHANSDGRYLGTAAISAGGN